MKQEEKTLLLRDLCARLPYGVVVELDEKFGFNKGAHTLVKELLDSYCVEGIKPYLRPMSSMTEEEIVEINSMGFAYWTTMINNDLRTRGPMSLLDAIITHHKMVKLTDWLNAHHFDYRGLIEKGLAIAVTENNNPYKE